VQICLEASLAEPGVDSLDLVVFMMAVEDEFWALGAIVLFLRTWCLIPEAWSRERCTVDMLPADGC
jgi:hypothetical protein